MHSDSQPDDPESDEESEDESDNEIRDIYAPMDQHNDEVIENFKKIPTVSYVMLSFFFLLLSCWNASWRILVLL